ncbi:MAG: MATE family efflux transporter [Eubacterium sp.]|nr:MATE family efflux transporter [Eubacterium sp.]
MKLNRVSDLTKGNIIKSLLLFALPMILGNLLQQLYNITDSVIVGRFVGAQALAAVGAAYALMTFLTSVIIGLCMGSGSLFSAAFGANREKERKESMWAAFWLIAVVTVILYVVMFACTDGILHLLQVSGDVYGLMRTYVRIVFIGLGFVFLYNYFAYAMRAVGNSVVPLVFLVIATLVNIGLDIIFVIGMGTGVAGAAWATVAAQGIAGVGIALFGLIRMPELRVNVKEQKLKKEIIQKVMRYSFFTCMQQSVMNFGILMIQGLVNSFGTIIMAAFAAAVKIDTLAYMPAQEFANASSLFLSQNYSAGEKDRVKNGLKMSVLLSVLFCVIISAVVFLFARVFMGAFVQSGETAVIEEGIRYLRIEGVFYWGIGVLFLLYGLYRAIGKPEMSLVLTAVSLGTRVFLAYLLAPRTGFGVLAIWWAIPVGWFLADLTGYIYYKKKCTI